MPESPQGQPPRDPRPDVRTPGKPELDPATTPDEIGEPQPALAPAGEAERAEQAEPLDLLSPFFRERDLEAEGAEAPPMWLWVSIFGVLLFGTYYLGSFVGDFSPYPWLQQPDVAAATPAAAAAAEAVDGAQVYQSRCANCHQQGGEGIAGVFPPLDDSRWVTGEKGVLIRILLHGMQGDVEVAGEVYNGNMPGWAMLSDEELAAVMTHERTSWTNSAEPIQPEEVAAVRELLAGRSRSLDGGRAGAAREPDRPRLAHPRRECRAGPRWGCPRRRSRRPGPRGSAAPPRHAGREPPMTRCAHCELPVQGDGVSGAIGDGAAPVRYCCHGCRMVAETIGAEGLEPTSEERQLLYRFFGGALAAAFVMALSLAVSSGYGFGALRRLAPDTANIAHWAILAAALPALILLGVPVLQAALADVRRGRITLEVLFALGTGSAVGASAFSYIRGAGPVYLETATMLLALYTLGRFLDARAKGRAARVLGRLLEVPTSYYDRLHPDPGLVSPEVLRIGDRFRVRIGDALPVDGTVVAGRSFVDEAGLTGEARPVTKGMGDAVWAGTNTLDGALEVRATAVGTERRLARIEAATEAALARPPRVAAVADRVLRWLVPGTVVLALTTFAAWFALAGFDRALYAGLAVVLIACPCALGLAVPLSLVSALGGGRATGHPRPERRGAPRSRRRPCGHLRQDGHAQPSYHGTGPRPCSGACRGRRGGSGGGRGGSALGNGGGRRGRRWAPIGRSSSSGGGATGPRPSLALGR